jgi:hypothetical protein
LSYGLAKGIRQLAEKTLLVNLMGLDSGEKTSSCCKNDDFYYFLLTKIICL